MRARIQFAVPEQIEPAIAVAEGEFGALLLRRHRQVQRAGALRIGQLRLDREARDRAHQRELPFQRGAAQRLFIEQRRHARGKQRMFVGAALDRGMRDAAFDEAHADHAIGKILLGDRYGIERDRASAVSL